MQETIIKYFQMLTSTSFQKTDLFEIVFISLILFVCIKVVFKTKLKKLLQILLVFILFYFIASLLHMSTITWMLDRIFNLGILSVVILFQPEIRIALDHFQQYLPNQWRRKNHYSDEDKSIREICDACHTMSREKTGALIVIEQDVPLMRYAQTGISLHADISKQLLINIFEHNTPLHDGAVIIENNKIDSATCYLPLSSNPNINKQLGTRHRSGIGITEETDALCIIVSEETGNISVVEHGVIETMESYKTLRNWLTERLTEEKRRVIPFGKKNTDE